MTNVDRLESDLAALRAAVERQGEALMTLAEGNPSEARAVLRGDGLGAPAPDAGGERAPLGNIRVLPSQPLWDCILEWMKPYERADGYCPRCAVNRTGRVCDGCMGDLESILREMGPRWMRGPISPADAPLPEPVAFADRYGGLPAEVADAIRAILQARAVGGLGYADASNTADALAAWARAQQPALPDDVREAMREAAGQLDAAWNHGPTAYGHASQVAARGCVVCRLRELAGERGRGFATIPGWQAGEP